MVRTGGSATPRAHRPWVFVLAFAVGAAVAPAVLAAPGDVTSYELPSASVGVHDVALGPDGTVWFAERSAGAIGSLDPATGAVIEIPSVDAAGEPVAIAVAGDGTVWFAEQAANAIGELPPGGQVERHAVPTAGGGPADVAIGPDGSVWFTERFAHRIGRISPDGTIEDWPTPTGFSGPMGVAVAPDGSVWFSEARAAQLGRFDPSTGSFDEHALPSGSSPAGVAVGSDGIVWVALRTAGGVARLDPTTGTVATFLLEDTTTNPSSVAVAADGAAWFSQTAVGRLGRVAADGTITEVDLGGFTGPQGVAGDPAGSVWVAESGADRVSSVELDVADPPDETPPTIEIRAPVDGQWATRDAPLLADYACADEGGSGLASCEGPVASGAPVPATRLGLHRFEVVATDGAGNTASAETPYLVFRSVDAPPAWTTVRAGGGGVRLSLGMALPFKDDPGVAATSAPVDCTTGQPVAEDEPTDVRERVANDGTLELRWLAPPSWRGACRTLTLAFAVADWSGAHATFGPYLFA